MSILRSAQSYKVVILSASGANLVPCVNSVLENEPSLTPDRIVVVDDGAAAEARSKLPEIRWISGTKPFVFARNANIGIREAGSDVILLNDDARLITREGFSRLSREIYARPKQGIYSPGIKGLVGNPNQYPGTTVGFRPENKMLAFVCVYITKDVYDKLGPLDEQFIGYGYEDNDYCARCLASGLELGVWDGCVVNHSGHSSYRARKDLRQLTAENQRRFRRKWAEGGHSLPPRKQIGKENPMKEESVDLLYIACNRLEFTKETFTTLLANTDWQFVRELFVYDDGSTDGTREWLEEKTAAAPVTTRFVRTNYSSPVAAMVDFIRSATAPMLAKIDNDTMTPPGWLRQSLSVFVRHPELSLLGIEAMYPVENDANVTRSFTTANFISGLGLYRREAFDKGVPTPFKKWFGLEEWQMQQGAELVRGWINPALPVFLLDRCPFEPWKSYSDNYVSRGWQRPWPKYDEGCKLWSWRWPEAQSDGVAVAGEVAADEEAVPGEVAVADEVAVAGKVAADEEAVPGEVAVADEGAVTVEKAVVVEEARFLCAMRVKNEASHIGEVIERVLPLCRQVFVFDDHSSDQTVEVCRAFGNRVVVFQSPFEGFDEARDKNYLLQKVVEANPEWVLWIDGDEVLESRGAEIVRDAADNAHSGIAGFSLKVAYVWNDPQHVRVDGIFGRFKRPSLFRLKGQPLDQINFRRTAFGGNLHCGNVPNGVSGAFRDLDVRLKHYGYMTVDQRTRKHKFYTTIDPGNELEDNYRHLIEIPGARHAPGPPEIVPWSE